MLIINQSINQFYFASKNTVNQYNNTTSYIVLAGTPKKGVKRPSKVWGPSNLSNNRSFLSTNMHK